MKKIATPFLLLLLSLNSLFAQKGDLMVKSSDNGLYLEHKVVPREGFFSVGRVYNVSAKLLASFNKVDMNKGLFIDQKIRIPLTDTNFTQQGNSGSPVYYKVGDNEDLGAVSDKFRNVSVANLRNWNNLSGDEVKGETKLIIGFLQSKEIPSVTINNKPANNKPANNKPELVPPVAKVEEKTIAKVEEKKVVKVETKPIEQKIEEKPVVKEETKLAKADQGYFKNNFENQIKTSPASKNETVASSIFKTTSGWEDSKYYVLIDKVPSGTIVKVINPSNNKAVYAKVLGEMSGIRQNEGLSMRISNAAASVLDISEQDKFIVKINY